MEVYPPTDWKTHPLHAAAKDCNPGEVERLLLLGHDVNECLDREGTPFHIAIRYCHDDPKAAEDCINVLRLLLAKGANIGMGRDSSGIPLHLAAYVGHVSIADLLVKLGADINGKDNERRTPLHWAADGGKLGMVEYLIAHEADVNAVADFEFSGTTARAFR